MVLRASAIVALSYVLAAAVGVLHPLNERGYPLHADLSDLIARAEENESVPPPTTSRVCQGEFHAPNMASLQRLHTDSGHPAIVLSSTWRLVTSKQRVSYHQSDYVVAPSILG